MPRKTEKKKKKAPKTTHRLTIQDVVMKKRNAKNALINVLVDDDSIFTIILRRDGDELYVECSEDANPSAVIANSYPEYFDDDK